MWALVIDNAVVTVAGTPHDLVRLDDGTQPLWSSYIDDDVLAACGWFRVVDNPPPFDPATQVRERGGVSVGDGGPFVPYTVRAKTAAELAADADAAARLVKAQQVAQAVDWLRTRASAAAGATATSGNAVAVLNSVLDDLALFLDRFADFIEGHNFDRQGD